MDEKQHGPWKITDSREIFDTDFVKLRNDQVIKPDGSPGTYATVQLKSGAAVLPIDQQRQVYLVKQFRYSLGKESIEVISGGIDEGEDPLESARREVQEEAGITAGKWTPMGKVDLDTSIVNAPVYLFLAQSLQFKEPQREGTEKMVLLKVGFQEAFRMVQESIITHSPSCVLILKAKLWLSNSN